MLPEKYVNDIVESLKKRKLSKDQIAKLKMKLCAKYRVKKIPTDIELLLSIPEKEVTALKKYLQSKPSRSSSGVAPIAVMTSPASCPHGKCATCPGGPNSHFGNVPQSYTGTEPATMRGIRSNFDPYIQVFNRLEQYIVMGHMPDKAELIIMGGTFPARKFSYQRRFVAESLKAMNDFSKEFFRGKTFLIKKFKEFFELPGDVGSKDRTRKIHKKILALKGNPELKKEQTRNETAVIRCVGMTIETRSDYAGLKEGNELLELGATRVEIGIQSVYNEALINIDRGHTVEQSIDAIKNLKDLSFKLNFHMMLGLPGIDKEKEINGLKKLFDDSNFKPDMLKIYPCMVLPGTKLAIDYYNKKYAPLTTQESAEIISEFKRHVPEYCRIMRVQRDIPTSQTIAGVDRTNLRQYVTDLCLKKEIKCRCIRCRQPKINDLSHDVEILLDKYFASEGTEFFISAQDLKNDFILGFCRMRFPSRTLRKEITKDSALIRELHVYGTAVPIGDKSESVQHKGLGRKLMNEAERIAKKEGKKKILIISGIGVRGYYRKLGYKKQGPYMIKKL